MSWSKFQISETAFASTKLVFVATTNYDDDESADENHRGRQALLQDQQPSLPHSEWAAGKWFLIFWWQWWLMIMLMMTMVIWWSDSLCSLCFDGADNDDNNGDDDHNHYGIMIHSLLHLEWSAKKRFFSSSFAKSFDNGDDLRRMTMIAMNYDLEQPSQLHSEWSIGKTNSYSCWWQW